VRSKSQQLIKLNHWLLERYRCGETAVLIIDEAQNLAFPVLEEIRLLTNLETSTDKLLQIVLSGQPELDEKLKLPQLRQLRQRIMLRCKTNPLSREEIGRYIVERLRIAGAADPQFLFAETAIDAVHLFSMGIPRVINLLCEHSLINSFVEQQLPIQSRTVEDVARDFQLDEVEPIAPVNVSRPDADVYNSEAFIQSLGEALARFRVNQSVGSTSRDRK
jgi:type II secretory pathway predicted ATPase ExeA